MVAMGTRYNNKYPVAIIVNIVLSVLAVLDVVFKTTRCQTKPLPQIVPQS